jgi:phosphoserine phosphatase RsbU/P
VDFAASVATADHVGGDFYDIFEADSGKIAIVLGDVSGKGIPAALLVSVVQGAIRSSTASEHEYACERINCMLCERTACERFATLFWGVFDPVTRTLRYVNAGHPAPFLIRQVKAQVADEPAIPAGTKTQIIRLDEGGPVLGVLPDVRYSAGAIEFAGSDTLILYSDGLNETTNRNGEEFGVDRMEEFVSGMAITAPVELCERLTNEVTAFSHAAAPADDRTLLVVRFPPERAAPPTQTHGEIEIPAVA